MPRFFRFLLAALLWPALLSAQPWGESDPNAIWWDGTSPSTTARIPFAQGISLNDGSESVPALNFINDTDTGIFGAANGIFFSVAGDTILSLFESGISTEQGMRIEKYGVRIMTSGQPFTFGTDYGAPSLTGIVNTGFYISGGLVGGGGLKMYIHGASGDGFDNAGEKVYLQGGLDNTLGSGWVQVGDSGVPSHWSTSVGAEDNFFVGGDTEVDGTLWADGALTVAGLSTLGQTKINTNSTTAFWVEQDGVKDNTFIVDTTNGTLGIGTTPGTASIVTLNTSASGGSGAALLDMTATGTHQFGINQTRTFTSVSGTPREFQSTVTFNGNFAFASPGALSMAFFMNDNRAISTAGTGDLLSPIYLNVARPSFGNTFSTTKTLPQLGLLTLNIVEGSSGTSTYSSSGTVTYTTALLQSGISAGNSNFNYVYSGSGTMNHVSRGFSSNITYAPSVTGGGTYNLNHYGVESKATGTTTGTTYGVAYYANLSGFDTNWSYVNEAAANNYMGQDNSKTYWGTGSGTVAARSLASDVFIQYTGTVWDFDIAAATTEIVFNNSGFDTDFRIESDTNDNMFHLDAGLNAVGIGGAAVSGQALKVTGATTITGTTTLATSLTGAAKLVSGVVSAGKFEKIFYIENPGASDSFPLTFLGEAATISRIVAVTDTGTVTFNIEKRSKTTPYTAGTDINSSDFTANSSALETSSFSSGSVSADSWLWYSATSVASSPTKLILTVIYNWS